MKPGKLADVGTTIFTVMSRRAAEVGALNVGQGFPDYDIDPRLAALVAEAIAAGRNQYAPMQGVPELRAAIAAKIAATSRVAVDPETEVTVTCGGTEALYSAIQAFIGPGDEAIAFDPAYDAYDPAIRLAGGRCVRIGLAPPRFRIDWARVERAVTARTRLLVLNNPHNPACTTASADDLAALAALAERHDLLVLGDEVYEHVVFDARRHHSLLALPALRARSIVVYSFGKTLHATGWRVGYAVAPPAITAALRRVHQYNTFSIATPLQHAIAAYLERHPDAWAGLSAFFGAKRDRLLDRLADTGYDLPPSEGTYFQLLGYGAHADVDDVTFAERLMREARVATIPVSPFYREPVAGLRYVRLCLAKRDETLDLAIGRLREFARCA
jgi:methionine aminotransferase